MTLRVFFIPILRNEFILHYNAIHIQIPKHVYAPIAETLFLQNYVTRNVYLYFLFYSSFKNAACGTMN